MNTTFLKILETDDTRSDRGGTFTRHGFEFQDLYALRLIAGVLEGVFDGYICEKREDYLAWKYDSDAEPESVTLVQVKLRSDDCVLANEHEVDATLLHFRDTIDRLRACKLRICKLVYNPHSSCSGCSCQTRIASRAAYKTLTEHCRVQFEPFIEYRASRRGEAELRLMTDLAAELQFLRRHEPRLYTYLTSAQNLPTLFRMLAGFLKPIENFARTSIDTKVAELADGRRVVDRQIAIKTLKTTISAAFQHAADVQTDEAFGQAFAEAAARAKSRLYAASADQAITSDNCVTLSYHDANALQRALLIVYASHNVENTFIFNQATIAVIRGASFKIQFAPSREHLPLHLSVVGELATHRTRVQLILSFVHAMAAWSRQGIILAQFRGDDQRFQHLYRCRVENGVPHFAMGDIDAMTLSTDESVMHAARWLDGAVLSKAIRYFYYGTSEIDAINATPTWKAPWNDNIVADIAAYLESQILPAEGILQMLTEVFTDELQTFPIIFSEIEQEFFLRAAAMGGKPIALSIHELMPTRLVADSIYAHPVVYYATSLNSQIGLVPSNDRSLSLLRYVPYLTQRWASAQRRDLVRGLKLDRAFSIAGVPLRLRDDVLTEIYGRSRLDYHRELTSLLNTARDHKPYLASLPSLITKERLLLRYRRLRLDTLATPLAFSLPETSVLVQRGSNLRFGLRTRKKASALLRKLGYRADASDELSIRVKGLPCSEPIATADRINASGIDATLLDSAKLPVAGVLQLCNPGEEAVLRSEESIMRQLEAAFSSGTDQAAGSEAFRAWKFIQTILPDAEAERRGRQNLWKGRARPCNLFPPSVTHPSGPAPTPQINSRPLFDGECEIITGAPGTGKTLTVASRVRDYLAENSQRNFPPARVLVAAATHFAIDNFCRVYNTLMGIDPPFRVIPEGRLENYLSNSRVDAAVYHRSVAHYDRTFPNLPPRKPSLNSRKAVQARLNEIHLEIETLKARIHTSDSSLPFPVLIPSHSRWRAKYYPAQTWYTNNELEARVEHLTVLAGRLTSTVASLPDENISEAVTSFDVRHLQLMSALVVASTFDAFDRIPDLHFDLIVIEEASQITLIKMVKLLTKVYRGCGPAFTPRLLLSGDPNQLPPFFATWHSQQDERISTTAFQGWSAIEMRHIHDRERETLYETICRHNSHRMTRLTRQYRMHHEIASLVQNLFYADENWLCAAQPGPGVVWVDVRGVPTRDGTSWYNLQEVDAVRSLLKRYSIITPCLIVTPYAAQVQNLHGLPPNVRVRTIDSCQGVEEENVIISFVRFASVFVRDPKRLNVAISRARRALYLVGDFSGLIAKLRTPVFARKYPHLAGLAYYFERSSSSNRDVVAP